MLSATDDGIVVVRKVQNAPISRGRKPKDGAPAAASPRSQKMTTLEYFDTPETLLPRELAFGVLPELRITPFQVFGY